MRKLRLAAIDKLFQFSQPVYCGFPVPPNSIVCTLNCHVVLILHPHSEAVWLCRLSQPYNKIMWINNTARIIMMMVKLRVGKLKWFGQEHTASKFFWFYNRHCRLNLLLYLLTNLLNGDCIFKKKFASLYFASTLSLIFFFCYLLNFFL